MRIVVIAPKEPACFFDLLWQGVWEATFDIAQYGVEVVDVTSPRHDVDAQRQVLADLIGQADAIAIVPADAAALDAEIAQHIAHGTAVITVHSDAPNSGRTLFVGPDGLRSGMLAGELLVKLMGQRGRVLSLPGPRYERHLCQRYEGLRLELERAPFAGCAGGSFAPGPPGRSSQGGLHVLAAPP